MIEVSAAAKAELEALTRHYSEHGRDRAIERLVASIKRACARYEAGQGAFLAAPRPYPSLASYGFSWTKEGAYWIAFARTRDGPVVAGVFYETADIPSRIRTSQ